MPNPLNEHSAVQKPILRHANEIGWQIIEPEEALKLRNGETGLFFYSILEQKVAESQLVASDEVSPIRSKNITK